jgi:hypothetical protein
MMDIFYTVVVALFVCIIMATIEENCRRKK